ncbi:MAG: hypothetical protein DCF16_01935 [Alphaproteobacteria bacterium]|nr:MAG: hypothetical protein DCF16_01935 [Alphaproteobacteria bacterium]
MALVLDASLNQLVGWSIAGSLAIGAIVLLAVAITRRQPPDSAQVSSSDVNVKMGDGNRVGMIGHRIERPDTESAKND